LIRIERDCSYSGMWRVRGPDGVSSDMVNKSRAMDAAEVMAIAICNMHDRPSGAPPTRQKPGQVSKPGSKDFKRAA
jgi:hypothetical protein